VLGGENIFSAALESNGYIVAGNESNGISKEVLKEITDSISIPAFGGGAESLNVAIATGIICAEFRRQNSKKQ
jgi:TrmH family RNA methyltransferase